MFVRTVRAAVAAAALFTVAVSMPSAQTKPATITTPKQHFGFNPRPTVAQGSRVRDLEALCHRHRRVRA